MSWVGSRLGAAEVRLVQHACLVEVSHRLRLARSTAMQQIVQLKKASADVGPTQHGRCLLDFRAAPQELVCGVGYIQQGSDEV